MKNYNYERKRLLLPEYGRHIHQMVDYLRTITDREQRNIQAKSVIAVMGNLNTVLRDSAEFTHKLWDHLFIMADFDLDVDSPYPIPSAESLNPMPEKLPYPNKRIVKRQYGKNVEKIIKSLEKERTEENEDQVNSALNNVARFMRTKSFEYNQEHPNNEAIIKEMKRMSENDISLDENAISNLKSDYKQFQTTKQKKSNHQQNRNQNKQNSNKTNKARFQRKQQ